MSCHWSGTGCTQVIPCQSAMEHAGTCGYRDVVCRIPGRCHKFNTWGWSEYRDHVKQIHGVKVWEEIVEYQPCTLSVDPETGSVGK